ncbi:MAG: cyclic nucleotide-binding domain-containing protein [Pseudomonadota bacterium]
MEVTGFVDLAGYAAAALVFLTFSMKTLMPLRVVAVASNIAFLFYGYLADLTPIVILHGLLLPLNLYRTWEHQQLLGRIKNALQAPTSIDVLLPHMTMQTVDEGTVLFRRGDVADRLYCVMSGRVLIEEFDRCLEQGALIGEIGLFTQAQTRTATAVAIETCQLSWIDRSAVLVLCQKHPEFALVLTRLVAQRMAENQDALRGKLAGTHPKPPNRRATG